MSDFNLRELTKTILESSTSADPNVVAQELLERINRKDYREALRQSLGQYVRVVSDNLRGPTPAVSLSGLGGGGGGPRSWKSGAAVKADWQRKLDARVRAEHGWLRVREMSAVDVKFVGDHRDKLASENAAAARFWRTVGAALDEHGVETVGELPAEVLMRLFGGAE